MAKQNSKHIRNNKKLIADKLQKAVSNVAKRNMYFVSGDKKSFFKVVNGKNKNAEFVDIPTADSAHAIAYVLNKSTNKTLDKVKKDIQTAVDKYSPQIEKYIIDLRFYNHTLNATSDIDKIIIIESRKDLAYTRYLAHKQDMRNKIYFSLTHSEDYKTL